MPEPSGRVIDLSVEVPGTPEEVWDAVATGRGITSWFVPHRVAEHEGGAVTMSFGSMGEETATVSVWDPPRRVVFTGGGEQPLANEWLVDARDGGTCVVRLVNSGFGDGDEWDDHYDAMTQGWKLLLQILRLHLTHFRGRYAGAIIPHGSAPGPNDAAFAALCDVLGVRDDLAAGDRLVADGDGAPELAATVDEAVRMRGMSYYTLVIDAPAPGTGFVTAEGQGERVMVSAYLHFYGAEGANVPDGWTPLLADRLPMAPPEPQPVT
jgi:uncharacterized protein YndB with AHSA1/START domain